MSESVGIESKAAIKTGAAALDELFQPVNRSDAPGLVVGIARHGKIVYRRGFGLASVELGVANTPTTRMRIGSTSKHFACLAALLLAEEGKLDLDADTRLYLPELPASSSKTTLRQFMTHTGGYRCYIDVGFLSDGMAIKPKGAALAAQVRQSDCNFAPGDKMMYNNGGYHMLSLVIERVSGLPFEQFLKDRIFTPLGMPDTASVPSDFEIHRGVATLHVPLPDGSYRRGVFPTEELLGEGAMISTVDDMLRWLAHLRGPKQVGSEHSWAQMLSCTRLNSGLVNPYALGLMRHLYRGVEVIHHAGNVIGGSSQMLTVPAHALDIIIIANGAAASPVELANQVIDTLLGDDILSPPQNRADSERFKSLLGKRYYSPSSGFLVHFADVKGKLGLSLLDGLPVPLRDEGDTLRLGFEDVAAGPFVLNTAKLAADGCAPETLEISESGQAESFQLLPETPPAPADAGLVLAGRYRAPDLDAEARILFDGESLKLQVSGAFATNLLTLEAFSADVFGFQIDGTHPPLRGVLNVERTDGRLTALRLNTPRTRRMLLERLGD
ncbi:serine hydrolase domain-containing protein [Undibacterium sp.]|jgi:D-aminopeptidase|uniref:serine hydrolase domain-containing protein n=1 Tax=Undibacterium sp. TaxID=1914977 RepID=UPI002B949EA6|nr:serine hydrolase [Undibacterium sp.]HTD05668.1 serine hydrolase [Undibacterium sp.]